jgi:CxxC motif-containing protein (DUF1111 family)
VSYSIGELATYQGSEYKCIQAHKSQSDWDPPAVPDLWSLVGTCGAPPPPTDPGVQSGVRTGKFTNGVSISPGTTLIDPNNDPNGFTAFFADGLSRFQSVEAVSNSPGANNGLGPRFNSNQCAACHAQPAVGGTGPAVNPQFAGFGSCASVSNLSETAVSVVTSGQSAPTPPQKGTVVCNNTNTVPSFITTNGPTREARFPFFVNSNGSVNTSSPNGGVEDLFTVAGRPDGASGCSLAQPNFTQALNLNNVIFRIPTPVFGDGLFENLDESTLLENQQANLKNSFGIAGTFNRNGNDGTITKFGWKAQNKSVHIFAGEAYNVEMGISNELFNNDRPSPEEELASGLPANCLNLTGTGYPEDTSNPTLTPNAAVLDDVSAFANFMRFLAPPPPATSVVVGNTTVGASTIDAGAAVFSSIGCATCHNPTLGPTQVSNFVPALSEQTFHPFTDLELHHMGTGFADNVSQGNAGGDQFRTAPLWGLGQRIFLDHDGRDLNLNATIQNHSSNGSEANTVIANFNNLNSTQQQELLDFLRSL